MTIMMPLRRLTTVVVGATLALTTALVTPPLALAQDNAPASSPPKPVMAFEHAGLESLFPDEKDAGLREALSMLGTRFKELKNDPSMQDEDISEIPDEAISLADTLLTSPMRMGITLGEVDPNTNAPRFGVVISFDMDDEAAAQGVDRQVEHLRTMSEAPFAPEPSQRWASMHDLAMPLGVLTYGPRKASDGWRYEMIFGEVENPDAVGSFLPSDAIKPGGATAARGMLDLAALTPLSEMLGGMLAMFAPQGGQIMQQMRDAGFVGAEAMSVEMTAGYTPTHGVERYVVRRAGRYAEALGLPTAPLSPEDFAVVPADATAAQIKKMDIQHSWSKMRQQFAQMGTEERVNEFLAQFRERTGVDLETDVIAALGDTSAVYLSDSTGGGSLLSAVMTFKLKDPAKISQAMERLTNAANQMASQAELGPGRVRLESAMQGKGVSLTSMRVRGLPMPLQPSFAIVGDWLVVGACAQACAAGARQIETGAKGLRDNASFASAWPKGVEAVGIGFVDLPRTVRSGYASVTLLGTALSNFVASPSDARDPRPIVGSFGELSEGVRPMLSVTRWSGEDMVIEVSSDRSAVVNVAGLLGVGEAGSLIMGAIAGSGMTAGAMEQRHSSTQWYEESPEDAPASGSEDDVAY